MKLPPVMLPIRVVAFETDFGGVVSNTRYLEYIERARYHFIYALGLSVEGVWESDGAQPVVRRAEIDYLGFARHEDELELRVGVAALERAILILEFELTRPKDGAVLMRARQTLAFLNKSWRPTRVPPSYREKLAS